MCGCEPGYVCGLCEDTPQDWRREDELEPPEVPAVEVDGRWQRASRTERLAAVKKALDG